MNYTKNYHLNQWEPSDRVLRTDFNEDNRKIDEALNAAVNASPYVKLKELVTTKELNQIDLDVGDIDFTQYWCITLYCSAASTANGLSIRVNDLTENYEYGSTSGGGSGIGKTDYMGTLGGHTVFYMPAAGARVGCCCFSGEGGSFSGHQFSAPCTWENLSKFNLMGSRIPAGTQVVLYGLKKT